MGARLLCLLKEKPKQKPELAIVNTGMWTLNAIACDLTEKNGHGYVRLVLHTLLKHCQEHTVLLAL